MAAHPNRSGPPPTSPRNLILAILLLGAGGWVWSGTLFGGPVETVTGQEEQFELPPIDGADTHAEVADPQHDATASQRLRMDLLEAWGSHVQSSENDVPNPFRSLPKPKKKSVAAAPGGAAHRARGSTMGEVPGRPTGSPPAADSVRLSLVFRAGATRRAIVNGATVTVGDAIHDLTVHAIHSDGIEVATSEDVVWYYAFQARWPRGYVPTEAEREAADQQGVGASNDPAPPIPNGAASRTAQRPPGTPIPSATPSGVGPDLDLDAALRELLERREAARRENNQPLQLPPGSSGAPSEPRR